MSRINPFERLNAAELISDDTAQTLNDFAVGTSIFFFTILFVFAFLPNVLAPFDLAATGGESIRGDRTASHLAKDVLSNETGSVVISGVCTEAFFSNTSMTDCPSYSPAPLDEITGNTDSVDTYVRILDDNNVVTYNGTDLVRGDEPASNEDTVVATRLVWLNDTRYELKVTLS